MEAAFPLHFPKLSLTLTWKYIDGKNIIPRVWTSRAFLKWLHDKFLNAEQRNITITTNQVKDFPGISSMLPVFQFLLAFVEILIQWKHIILKFYNHEIIIVQKQPKRDEPNNQHFRCFFWLHRQYLFSGCFRSTGSWSADLWVFQIQMWSFSLIESPSFGKDFFLVIFLKVVRNIIF